MSRRTSTAAPCCLHWRREEQAPPCPPPDRERASIWEVAIFFPRLPMRTRGLGIGLILAGVVAGCIPETQLQPQPDARSLAGEPSAAVAEAQGVRLIADGAAWKGHPSNLERRLTPVE